MAWLYKTPIIGDPVYLEKPRIDTRYHRGLMLCANQIRLLHPYYNTAEGRREWDERKKAKSATDTSDASGITSTSVADGVKANATVYESDNGDVVVSVSIPLPAKFRKLRHFLEKRARYANTSRTN